MDYAFLVMNLSFRFLEGSHPLLEALFYPSMLLKFQLLLLLSGKNGREKCYDPKFTQQEL
ncbi:hypothetical protein ccbrp13_60350 [Ktedonobacteria bacterium brp13]|nr:hypothetical protein ccbrp13_60350 [Ktedonobacteria bacterium brp13]